MTYRQTCWALLFTLLPFSVGRAMAQDPVVETLQKPAMSFITPTAKNPPEYSNSKVMLRPVNPVGADIPGISQAIVVEHGALVFLSGHVPKARDGSVPTGLENQLNLVFENLQATLQQAGTDFSNVARVTIYVRDYRQDLLPIIRRVRDRFIDSKQPPASALIGVAALFDPDVLVEIDAVAVVPSTR